MTTFGEAVQGQFEANRKRWDEWAEIHMRGSPTYPVEAFKAGEAGWEPNLPDDIGSVRGKSILYLQCHFGMDTLMWARQGACVTGADFSETAIRGARALNAELGMNAEFVRSNIYDLPDALTGDFDIVLTYYGIICWGPDLHWWAEIVAHYLKPGGFFYVADTHPFVDMLEGGDPGVAKPYLAYPYFTHGAAHRYEGSGTYAAPEAETLQRVEYEWGHTMAEIINAVVEARLCIEYLHEFPYTFCDVFN